MIAALALAAALQTAAAAPDTQPTSMPRITLTEALQRAARFDPGYVQALGQIDNAEWGRRAALATFVLPTLTAAFDASKFSSAFFNIGTGVPQDRAVNGQIQLRYNLLGGPSGLFELARTRADLESAHAGELQQRFATALLTESDFYAVLSNRELLRVAQERYDRAQDQLAVARARVLSGAAVQTDSLQLRLELARAQVALLQQTAALEVARMQLGRRVGYAGPVDAEPLAGLPDSLPITLPGAISEALSQGPQYRVARANERSAQAFLKGRRAQFLPNVVISGTNSRFDVKFFPEARSIYSLRLDVQIPIWDNGARELAVTQARVNRDVSRAIREDMERAAYRDVTAAYSAFTTARASYEVAQQALVVAQENFRVQDVRYRAGATTILDLLQAQVALTEAQANVVTSAYNARLAFAGLEAILGRRLLSR
ncbi:MAG: TolC family protein [Gemmatimonadota bacterium]